MKAITVKSIGLLVLVVSMVSFWNCDNNAITSPEDNPAMSTLKQAVPAEEITWANWSPDVLASLKDADQTTLEKKNKNAWGKLKNTESKLISREKGGKVGSNGQTCNNYVEIPQYALIPAEETITVTVLEMADEKTQAAPGVDFLPNMEFDKNVIITLSWEFLDVDQNKPWNKLDLVIYFSEDGGTSWFPVDKYSVNNGQKTLSFEIDHFTRYAWGF